MASLVYSTKSYKDYGLLMAFIFFSAIVGLVAAFGNIKGDLIIVGMAFGCTVLFLPLRFVYWGMAIICFMVIGQLEYFAGITAINWLPTAIGFGFYFRIPLEYLKSLRDRNSLPQHSPSFVIPVYLFLAMFVVSSLYNMSPAMQILVGSKTYLPYFSFLFIFLISYTKAKDLLDRLWKNFYWIAIIQVPLLLYQYFIIAPMRMSGLADDAMNGSFGGDPMNGGPSGAMAYTMVLIFALYLAMWKKKQTSTASLVLVSIVVALAILLAEVKVVIVFIPLIMFLVYRKESIRNPAFFLFILILMFGFAAVTLIAYSYVHTTIGRSHDLAGMFNDAFGYILDPKYSQQQGKVELGRLESITFWWNENDFDDIGHILMGYGPGASNGLSTVYISDLSRRYPLNLSRTVASQTLWDMGLLGILSYVAILLTGAWRAFALFKVLPETSFTSTILNVSGIGLLLMVIMVPYSNELSYVPAMQYMLMTMLAYIGVIDMLVRKNKKKGAFT